MRAHAIFAFAAVVFAVSPALAQEAPGSEPEAPAAPQAEPEPPPAPEAAPPPAAPSPRAQPAPVEPPDDERDEEIEPERAPQKLRSEGMRLGLEAGFYRAFAGDFDRLNAGSPSLIPVGADVSFHTSPTLLLGFHGHLALASRDDCLSADRCRGRAYALGAHIETLLSKRARSFVPWLRYGVGWEMIYHGGQANDAAGHKYRNAIDFMDLRVGGDFVVARGEAGRTTRIGPFIGLVGGISTGQSGVQQQGGGFPRNLDRDGGKAHLWFNVGFRGNLDL
ncbi:MAG: hypothetical protein KF819_28330 [Labilithrix sp.]|nr:hypothetical protein [Labilithrix sp.]